MRTHRLVDEMKLCVSDLRNRFRTHTTSLSVELHRVGFLADRRVRSETNKGVCFMFDPLQIERN
ncbi:hypothetical protein L917_06802 [Phytophthora nicotianae]|uniref:Uncharacterized protein n=1 Tax=Phytophthora nicotianae TaxID=4792 RepID=W2LD25_PHYNI|nr:hypothetical protein L917_06802 [Phytophthora nicotianae]